LSRLEVLADVAAVFNGKTPSVAEQRDKGHPVLKIKDVDEVGCFRGAFESFVDQSLAESFRHKWIQPGDTLILNAAHNSNYVGSKTYFAAEAVSGVLPTGEWLVVRGNSDITSKRYIHHWLTSARTRSQIRDRVKGIHLYAKDVAELPISLPPLKQQERIAAILDRADAIRRKRREALKLADDFLRSAFLDLFGDPVANPKRWPKDKFGNLGTLDRGKSRHRPRDEPALYGGPHPFIQTGDVANCDGIVRRYTQTYSDLGLSQSRKWPAGTLAITIAANIGKTGILGFDACFPDSVVGFTASPPISAEFIQFWLGQIQNRLEETAPQSAQKNINLDILRDLPVPVPPEGLLNRFTSLVLHTRESKLRQDAMLREADLLFGSIQQGAFHGELTAT